MRRLPGIGGKVGMGGIIRSGESRSATEGDVAAEVHDRSVTAMTRGMLRNM